MTVKMGEPWVVLREESWSDLCFQKIIVKHCVDHRVWKGKAEARRPVKRVLQ